MFRPFQRISWDAERLRIERAIAKFETSPPAPAILMSPLTFWAISRQPLDGLPRSRASLVPLVVLHRTHPRARQSEPSFANRTALCLLPHFDPDPPLRLAVSPSFPNGFGRSLVRRIALVYRFPTMPQPSRTGSNSHHSRPISEEVLPWTCPLPLGQIPSYLGRFSTVFRDLESLVELSIAPFERCLTRDDPSWGWCLAVASPVSAPSPLLPSSLSLFLPLTLPSP